MSGFFTNPNAKGQFTQVYSGFSGTVTGLIRWFRSDKIITLSFAQITGTSNSTGFNFTGLATYLQPGPPSVNFCVPFLVDNGAVLNTGVITITGPTVVFSPSSVSPNWTPTGTKGTTPTAINVTYPLF